MWLIYRPLESVDICINSVEGVEKGGEEGGTFLAQGQVDGN